MPKTAERFMQLLRLFVVALTVRQLQPKHFMKTLRYTKTLIALAVAIAAAATTVVQAQEKPIPPPATGTALPPDIAPNSSVAQVVKLVQAGVEIGVIKNFVSNSMTAFGLDADQIIALNDVGVPAEIINAMMSRDKILYATDAKVNSPAPVVAETAPPVAPVTVNYFNDSLTPYGAWVEVEGYGRCWRPTVVNYDSGWRPYCDRGHWVYTDCGWYWDSDYSWGVTFHYGRWFRHSRFGWCWYPDTEWAPSWVTWRSGGEYCGWAPLPPLAVYRPGFGFSYRGENVAVEFGFGLEASCFTFVSSDHFCDHHPRRWCPDENCITQIYNHTTVINNYDIHNTTIVNNGIAVTQFNGGGHRPIQPVTVGSLPNAGRHGWRGDDNDRSRRDVGADNNSQRQLRPQPVQHPGNNVSSTTRDAGNVGNRDNSGNIFRGDRTARPTENRDANRRPGANPAPQTSSGSVFIQRQPSTAGVVVDTGRNNREQSLPDNRWQSARENRGDENSFRHQPVTSQPRDTAPVVSAVTPTAPQNRWQSAGNDRSEENRGRRQAEISQPHYTAPVVAERNSQPVFTAPERIQTQERSVERHVEAPPARTENVQRSYTPPPAPSQSHESERSSSRSSERNAERSSDSKDKKDR
jgi:hypothetical protein